MTGIVKTYIESKGYGFIKGSDNKDYFFHKSNIKSGEICDGALVTFEKKATPKGYSAEQIEVNSSENIKYEVPKNVYLSKKSQINGWENVYISDWLIDGTSEISPDKAKEDMIDKLKLVGANCGLEMEYYSTVDSEPGTGTGTHYYTVHNFCCTAANIGKKSFNGEYTKEELCLIETEAEELKKELMKKTKKSKIKKWVVWTIVLFLTTIALGNGGFLFAAGFIFLGYVLGSSTNYDEWLTKVT